MCTTQLDQLSADHSQFDFQVPCGSICQHRFTSPEQYAPLMPFIVSDSEKVSNLRELYLSKVRSSSKKINIVGISWRGGSKSRMQKKSLPIEKFASILKDIPDTLFVSLQYGNVDSDLRKLADLGINIVHDTNIKPIKDLHGWIDQVDACDAVLSVANTTIHGAGGLNKPTMCLLGQQSDWRWFDDEAVQRSYWYPSVGIIRATKESGWDSVLQPSRSWLLSGASFPTGPITTKDSQQYFLLNS